MADKKAIVPGDAALLTPYGPKMDASSESSDDHASSRRPIIIVQHPAGASYMANRLVTRS